MNKKFCRIVDGGKRVEFAPDFIFPNPNTPTDEEYIAHGWLKNAISAPETRDGYNVSSTTYEARDGQIFAVYEYEAIEKTQQVKRYSKKKFSLALARRGMFDSFDAWASSTEIIEGSGLTISRVLADSWYMSSVDDEFKAVKLAAESKFGADKIAKVLAESEDDEW